MLYYNQTEETKKNIRTYNFKEGKYMAGHNNQGNQEPKRLDENSNNFQGEISEQDRKALKDWAEKKETKYVEQRNQKYQVENEKAAKAKEKLDDEHKKKKETFENTKKSYEDFLDKNKNELNAINKKLDSLNKQKEADAKALFDKKASEIKRKYDEKTNYENRQLTHALNVTQRLKEVIKIKKNLEQVEKERRDVKYTEWGENSFKTDETIGIYKRKITQNAIGLKHNAEEQKENIAAYQAKMTELINQLNQLKEDKDKFTTKFLSIFSDKKKKKLIEEIEQKQREIKREMEDLAEKQKRALDKESKLREEFNISQTKLTDGTQKFTEDNEANLQLLGQEKQLKEELEKILDKETNYDNEKTFKLGTSSELETFISQAEEAIKKRKDNLAQIEVDKKKALDRAYKKILEECKQKDKEYGNLDKQKRDLERKLEEKKLSMNTAEKAYQNNEANYNKNIKDIQQTAMKNRTPAGNEYLSNMQTLKKSQTEIEARLKKYALLSQAIDELKHSERKVGSTNSNEFQTMVEALESFSTIMRNPESKQADMDQSCINAIQACENYVEKRNQDHLSFMRSGFGKYRINRANSISSALKTFSPGVTAYLNQQRENTNTRVRVSFTDNSNQRMVRSNPQEGSKVSEKKLER